LFLRQILKLGADGPKACTLPSGKTTANDTGESANCFAKRPRNNPPPGWIGAAAGESCRCRSFSIVSKSLIDLLPNSRDQYDMLTNFRRVRKGRGHVCYSLLATSLSASGHCNVRPVCVYKGRDSVPFR